MLRISEEELKNIRDYFLGQKQTVAVAESVTGGLLQFAFSSIADASQFFQGGMTAYNIGQKYKHLNVEPIHAIAENGVSQKIAIEMAHNVCRIFCSDWGIGVTGYASPVPQSDNKMFAFYAIVFRGEVKDEGRLTPLEKLPTEIQEEYVQHIMNKLSGILRS